jgi:hypothetical protein
MELGNIRGDSNAANDAFVEMNRLIREARAARIKDGTRMLERMAEDEKCEVNKVHILTAEEPDFYFEIGDDKSIFSPLSLLISPSAPSLLFQGRSSSLFVSHDSIVFDHLRPLGAPASLSAIRRPPESIFPGIGDENFLFTLCRYVRFRHVELGNVLRMLEKVEHLSYLPWDLVCIIAEFFVPPPRVSPEERRRRDIARMMESKSSETDRAVKRRRS